MKNKTFALFALSIVFLALVVGAVSAAGSFTSSSVVIPFSVAQDVGTFTITFNLNNSAQSENVDWLASVFDNGNGNAVFTSFSPLVIADGSVTPVQVPASVVITFNKTFTGIISGTVSAVSLGAGADVSFPFSVTITPTTLPSEVFSCITTHDALATNLKDNLDVSIDDITVDEGFGGEDEDFEWFPLDTITIDVDVDNNGPKDIDNVALGWGLYDKTSQKWVIDDEESDFDLNDDDTESKSLTFKLDEDVDEFDSSHDYVFYTWANGEDNEAIDPALDATCDYAFQDVEMQIEEFVILDDVQYPDVAQCTEEVTITGDVWNLDDSDQDDVYVLVTNVALGLKEQRMEVGDVDSLENTPFEFMFKVPEGLDEKTYPIMFDVYDDHDDIYENSFNEESSFMVPLTVKGNCGAVSGSATVSATLESGKKAGDAMVVKTTVTNKGTKAATFMVNAAGYSEWASAASVSEDSFTLEAGKSKDVTITLQTKADAKGEQTFNVEVLSGNEIVTTQPVAVMVEGKSAGFLSAITGNVTGDGKSLWIIGALNVLLVFAIIVIAIRFLFRK